MTDRPIIFSAPMVRALLAGRKTQTRRALKEQRRTAHPVRVTRHPEAGHSFHAFEWRSMHNAYLGEVPVPYAIGDRLWVREAFSRDGQSDGECLYRATVDDDTGYYAEEIAEIRWRPSIHMPRWASRLTLIVTDVRVQRLQEISEADAMAEGADKIRIMVEPREHLPKSYQSGFEHLWNSIYGPEAWDANPWVAALTFRVIRANIDSREDAQ